MRNAFLQKITLSITFTLVWASCTLAQSLASNQWYLGNSDISVFFNETSLEPQVLTGKTPIGVGGGVTVSDHVSGNVIFYTDGQNIYDRTGTVLPGQGGGLNGDAQINRAADVVPLPYSDGRYVIFTNNPNFPVNEIQYTIVNRTLQGNAVPGAPAAGDVVVLNQPTGLTNPAKGMIVVRQDVNTYWLISQDTVSTEIRVTAINSGVLGATIAYNLWSDTSNPSFDISAFAFDPVNNKLAAAPDTLNRNVVLFDFDPTSGVLTLDGPILNSGLRSDVNDHIYGLAWSSSGEQLYISRRGDSGSTGDVYQYHIHTPNALNSILPAKVFRSYGLKLGPDNKIYHLYQATAGGIIELGVIDQADSVVNNTIRANGPQYDSTPFDNTAGINAQEFPATAGAHFDGFNLVTFDVLDTCANRTTKFFSSVEPTPTSYHWDFGDGESSEAINPVHTYMSAGNYSVSLTVSLDGFSQTLQRSIEVVTNDLSVDLGMDTVRCVGEILTLDAGAGAISYAWNTGETTQTIQVDTTGVYSVTAISPSGCAVYDYIGITTYQDDNIFRNQWYFGQNAGIDFNTSATPIVDTNLISSPQASSSVSDLNGRLLFYTDGETIWNKEHAIMINGDNIGGDNTSMQGAMIVPMPGDTTTYYVFTTDPVYGDNTYDLKYSVVDMKLDMGRGEVVVKNMSLMKNSSEKMTALGLGSSLTMLYVHEYGNSKVRAYRLTPDGIEEPVVSWAGASLIFDVEKMGTAEMQIGTGVLAVAIQDLNNNYVEFLQVNDTTGQVTELARVDINEPTPSLIYGLEFSSSMEKLYVSVNGNGSKLLQYDLDSLFGQTPVADLENSKFVLGTSGAQYGALATGSDGVIYLAIEGQSVIGTINSPNEDNGAANFNEAGFDLSGRTSGLGLPNFVQNNPVVAMQAGIAFSNTCLGQETIFDGTGTSVIDEFFWTFGDGTSGDMEDMNKVYGVVGTYPISLQVTNRCGLDTLFNENLEIFPIPLAPTVIDAANVCNGPVTLEAWPTEETDLSYTWSTGDTLRTLDVSEPAQISVFITDGNGCQSNPRFTFVDDTSPIVDLGANHFLCQGAAFDGGQLDAENPGSIFSWSVNNVANGNTLSVQSVDTSLDGEFEYSVQVEDIFGCVGADTILLTILPTPEYTITPDPTSGCGAADGDIEIDILDNGEYTYQVTGATTVVETAITGPGTVLEADQFGAGAYTVIVRDIVTGCTNSVSTIVDDSGAGFSIASTNPIPGCGSNGQLQITLGGIAPANVTYELFDQSGSSRYSGTTPVALNSFDILALDSGLYDLVITEVGGTNCTIGEENVVLNALPYAEFLVQPEFYCGTSGKVGILPVTIDPAIIYTWVGGAFVGSNIGDSVTVSTAALYTVTSSGLGYCEQVQTVSVTQNDKPALSLDISGEPCDGERTATAQVTSTPVGNLSYQWSDRLTAQQRLITQVGNYSVFALDQGTGCLSSIAENIEVYPPLTVSIISEPNCEDNGEIFIDAYANITEDVAFSWVGPIGALTDTTAEITTRESGAYTVTVASKVNICTATSTFEANIVPIDESLLTLPNKAAICPIDPDSSRSQIMLDAGAFASFVWRLLDESDTVSVARMITVNNTGTYEVEISNGFTCILDQVEVIDNCRPVVYVPTAFTPDGNGVNDEFYVYENPYVSDFDVKIYSRWGELVYQSSAIDFRWTGVFKGQLLQGGNYVYVMSFKSNLQPELGRIEQRGGVVLIR